MQNYLGPLLKQVVRTVNPGLCRVNQAADRKESVKFCCQAATFTFVLTFYITLFHIYLFMNLFMEYLPTLPIAQFT
jgi:hypothetical protein